MFKLSSKKQSMSDMKKVFTFPVSPYRQYKRLMIAGITLFVLVVAVHAYFFYSIESHAIFKNTSTTFSTGPKVNEKKLTSVLSRYNDKESVRKAVPSLTPISLDPSK